MKRFFLLPFAVAPLLYAVNGLAANKPQPQVDGGDIVWGIFDWPTCNDPQQSPGRSISRHPTFDNLVDVDRETGEVVPWLAQSWQVNAEGTEYRFNLRTDVTFSNGEKLDAGLVKDNLDGVWALYQQGKSGIGGFALTDYAGAEVIDDHTLVVRFKQPRAYFLQSAGSPYNTLGIIARESLKKTAEERCANGVIGSGAFVIKEVVPNEKIVLERRKDYAWAPATAGRNGPAHLDRITFRVIPEYAVRAGALLKGDVDAYSNVLPSDIEHLQAAGFVWLPAYSRAVQHLYFNTRDNAVTHELAVRRAIRAAIDRNAVISAFFTAHDQVANGFYYPKLEGYVDFSHALRFDARQAQRLLDEAGWRPGPDGVRQRDGKRLEVKISFGREENAEQFELIQQQLADMGIAAKVVQASAAERAQELRSGDWNLRIARGPGQHTGVEILSYVFHGKVSSVAAAVTPTPELDGLIDAASREMAAGKRAEYLREAQQFIVDQALSVPLYFYPMQHFLSPRLHEVSIGTDGGIVEFYNVWQSPRPQ